MADKNQNEVRCTYFKVHQNFKEILPAVSDINRAAGRKDRQINETSALSFNFTFELIVF